MDKIYFIFNGHYCEASYINEQIAQKVDFITKEEYDEYKRLESLEIKPKEE